jgi:DNA polymerase-4
MGRVIFLVDMNAFFISCETARNPELKGKPAAVAGDPKNRAGIVLTANYEARKYKVKTTMTIREARQLCPEIIFVPPDREYYRYISGEVMKILSGYSPIIQQNSIDEAWLDMTGCDIAFGKPLEAAQKIMNDMINKLDMMCSIGISENKFLAKMASEMKKPLGITEVWQKDVKDKIWPLPVGAMYGIGKRTEKKLSDIAIHTIGDIAKSDRNLLIKTFGKYGEELYDLAYGIDNSPVDDNPLRNSKSISRSTTLPNDIVDLEYAKRIVLELAEEVGAEARKTGYSGRTVSIAIKYNDFKSITRQKAISPTYLTKEIYQSGCELLEKNWNLNRPVRLLGIGLGDLQKGLAKQVSFFDLSGKYDAKEEKIERVMDKIRQKYGDDKIKRAKTIHLHKT